MQRHKTENYPIFGWVREWQIWCGPIDENAGTVRIAFMNKISARTLTVVALAALGLGIMNVTKIGSAPAQESSPPQEASPPIEGVPGSSPPGEAGSSGSSGPGASGSSESSGSSGFAGGSGSGSSGFDGNSGSSVSGNDGTVSHTVDPNEPKFEWTLERMLLATPMPMSQEERDFMHKHPSLEKLRDWTQAQFDDYVGTKMGQNQAAQEGFRWRGLVSMLRKQVKAGSLVLKKSPIVKGLSETDTDLNPTGSVDALAEISKLEKLIQSDSKEGFAKLKLWRQEIALLAPRVEELRKEAEKKGLADRFNDAVSAVE